MNYMLTPHPYCEHHPNDDGVIHIDLCLIVDDKEHCFCADCLCDWIFRATKETHPLSWAYMQEAPVRRNQMLEALLRTAGIENDAPKALKFLRDFGATEMKKRAK